MYARTFFPSETNSISSNPESPASNGNEDLKDSASDFDYSTDYSTKTYLNELFENGLKEERFRIDRKKLEDMLQNPQSPSSSEGSAEEFFRRVMSETTTQISWPSKLKIGAKSKKDPHVKIVGKPEAVKVAKEKILEILDTKKNRVTLKMDISHTDHSYTIGKGGFKIQQVMQESGCHIHFPDSNRNGTAEKSNQVSIAGQASGVELARAKIRDLLPLVFTFELPNGESVKPGEESSPAIQHIQQTYSFNVSFRPLEPLGMGRTLLVVRGCQRLLSRLRQGLALLMEYLTGSKTIPIMGFMKTEIAPQHHQFVMGPCEANIQMIMSKTGAKIDFPDNTFAAVASPMQQHSYISGHTIARSKSTVLIYGSFDSVCLAWQELLKYLPLVLMFDLKEGQELDPDMVNNFMEAFDISIMVRPKLKENTKSVLIRGAEKDSKILFQVRNEILGLEDDDFYPVAQSLKHSSLRMSIMENYGRVPLQNLASQQAGQNFSPSESLSILSNIIQRNPQIVGLLNNLSSAYQMEMPQPSPQPMYRANIFSRQIQPNQSPVKNVESWINRPDTSYAFSSGINVCNYFQGDKPLLMGDSDSGIHIPTKRYYGGLETGSDICSRPESSASSVSSVSSNDTPDFKRPRFIKPDFKTENNFNFDTKKFSDYESKKVVASKVMQQSVDGVRTPNHLWSGYGFSKSMPDFSGRKNLSNSGSISEYLETDSQKVSNLATELAASKAWNTNLVENQEQMTSPFTLSNFWENVPRQKANFSSVENLEQLFCMLDLDNYLDLFIQQEIDLSVFVKMTESDLQDLNISYGARRKMLSAISSLRDQRMYDWPVKNFRIAPGAERRAFSNFDERRK